MNKFFKTLEIIWLLTAIACAAISVYFLIIKDTDSALYFVFVFIIASIMYLLRKHQRKTQEKVNDHNSKLKKS
jgi:hypothetical protein